MARAARGMTGVDLARAVRSAAARRGLRSGTDKQRVRKWEAGVIPDPESQIYIAEAFGVPLQDVDTEAWPHWLPDAGVIPLGPESTVPALREALRSTMERSRRTFLAAVAGTGLVTLADTWATADSRASAPDRVAGQAVGDELVSLLEETGSRLSALATEQRQHTAPLLDAHLTTVTDLIAGGRYPHALGTRLHSLAAHLSQTVAWHRFDHGLHHEASKFWIAGLHSAHAIGDADMGAALLGDLAYQASWCRDPRTAASILQRALTRTEHPAAQALLQLRLARALAVQGDRRATLRALSAAELRLGAPAADPVPTWCAWMSDADLAVDSGQSLLELGETRRAHQLIREGQALLPPSRDKTRGVFLAYQAQSHMDLGEPDLAAAAASQSFDLAQRIGAPRCLELVRNLIPRFAPHARVEGVPELLARAAS